VFDFTPSSCREDATRGESRLKRTGAGISTLAASVVLVLVVALALSVGAYVSYQSSSTTATTHSSTATTASTGIDGVVTGYVTVGPSQSSCTAGQQCNENMTGYSLVFTPQCTAGSSDCQARTAALTSWGHYSILLPAGNYSVTGLYPSCSWVGCSSAFPKTIAVEGGMQLVFNVDIDTEIG
jgi:hypothetical protein